MVEKKQQTDAALAAILAWHTDEDRDVEYASLSELARAVEESFSE